MVDRTDVIIVGGGLAGIAAAVYLAPNRQVTLIEASHEFGGQCSGHWTENGVRDLGVHGVYPRYVELMRLLEIAGVSTDDLIPAGHQYVLSPESQQNRVRMPAIPAPLHGLVHGSLLNNVGLRDRFRLLCSSARLLGISPDSLQLDEISLQEIATRARVPPTGFRLVFEPLAWIGFFLHPSVLSAQAYLSAMRFLITGQSDSWRARWVPTPNGEKLIRPLAHFIKSHGGRLLTGVRATAIKGQAGRVTCVQASTPNSEWEIEADSVICAVPAPAASSLVMTLEGGANVASALARLGTTCVRTFRFYFAPGSSPLLRHGVMLTRRAGFVFFSLNNIMPAYGHTKNRVIEAQCGPDMVESGVDEVEQSLRRLLSDGAQARLLRIDETPAVPYARFAVGSTVFRPGVQTPWPNLFFAGDWVHDSSGAWFMERAVSTGHQAANAVLGIRTNDMVRRSLEAPGVRVVRAMLRQTVRPLLDDDHD